MHTHSPLATVWQKTNKPGSIIELTGTITASEIADERAHALAILSRRVQVDGFRDGAKIPEMLVVAKVGEQAVKETAVQHMLDHALPSILASQNILPITAPNVSMAFNEDGGAEVTIVATTYPTITLPDYKKIAANVMKDRTDAVVEEGEVTEALTHFARERMRIELIEGGASEEDALAQSTEASVDTLPALDDMFVKQIGFDSAEIFTTHIRTQLLEGKTQKERSDRRVKMLKEIATNPVEDVPEPLIEYEIAKMEAGLADYLAQTGKSLEGYFASVGKSRADIHTEWAPEARKRAAQQLALIEIAKREGIHEDTKELEALVESVVLKNKDAEIEAVTSHYQVILRNEKVLEWLENQK
jgi:FKBP-type peptidyl-prolyl cis-trans isomerase (trigger factor)